jgi:hypothetical protein
MKKLPLDLPGTGGRTHAEKIFSRAGTSALKSQKTEKSK